MELLWAPDPHPHMQPYIMAFMRKNFSCDIHNTSYSTIDSLMMLLASGAQTKTHDMIQWNGNLSKAK